MSTGLAIYGLENVKAEDAFKAATALCEHLGYPLTGAGYYNRVIVDGVDDIELMEVSTERLLYEIQHAGVSDFRVYSESASESPWAASVGFSTNQFGSFYCMDFQCAKSFDDCYDRLEDGILKVEKILGFKYGLIFDSKSNFDAMWYARGENLKTLYPFESPIFFSEAALGRRDSAAFYESKKLRMVYPVNILNEKHLLIAVDSTNLLDWVQADSERGYIVSFGSLWCWKVKRENLASVNCVLGSSSALLAWNTPRKNTVRLP